MRKINYSFVLYFMLGYLLLGSMVLGIASSNSKTGVVNGSCVEYYKDYKYVTGISVCPILSQEGKKVEMLSPSAMPNVNSSKIKYIELNGIKDASLFYSLLVPLLLVLSILPLLVVMVKLDKKNLLLMTPRLATFRNITLIFIYYVGFSSFFSIYSFYFGLK
jgi:hypothetical protein